MLRRTALLCAAACVLLAATTVYATTIACNTQSSLAAETGVYPFVAGTTFAPPVACSLSSGALLITSAGNLDTASAGYLNRAFRVVNGFRVSFSFIVNNGAAAEGFAFVFQKTSLQVVGGSSANLGYNFANNVAVEFDMYSDSTITDTAGNNHVEVHTVYGTGSNSADNNVAKLATTSTAPGVIMSDGKAHAVIINYIPASTFSSSSGAITVQIDGGTILSTTIDSDRVSAMFATGTAYVGFTGSSSASIAADVLISNFAISTIPVDATQTFVVSSALSSGLAAANAKGTTTQGVVQLVDKCGTYLPISMGSLLTANVTTDGTTISSTGGTSVVDNADGTYNIFWWNSVAAIPKTTYKLAIKYNGASISGSPFTVTVVPGIPNAATSTVTPTVPTSFIAGANTTLAVSVKDALSNPTLLPTGYYIAAGFQSSYDTILQYTTPIATTTPTYNVVLSSTTAQTGVSVLVRVHSPTVSPDVDIVSPVTVSVVAGAAAGGKSGLTGTGLSSATAHTTATIVLAVNDAYSNPVNTNTGVTVAGRLITTLTSGGSAAIALTAVYTSGNLWTLTYITDTAGYYTVAVTVNGVATQNSGAPYVQSGVVARGNITATIASGTAAATTSFTIQAYDAYKNARTAANAAGSDFAVTISTETFSATTSCATTTTLATNVYLSSLLCTYTLSGQYRIDLVPLKATTYKVGLNVTGAAAFVLASNTFAVVADIPYALKSSVQGLPNKTTSGIASTFTITVRDANSNVRTGVDDRAYISLTQLTTSSGTVLATISSTTPNTLGNYTVSYLAGLAGTYTASVKISGVAVPMASAITYVVPGVMLPSMSQLSGQGLLGGVGLATVTYLLQARDAAGNSILLASNSLNRVYATTMPAGSTTVITSGDCAASTATGGLYTCTYAVPAYVAATPTYTLIVYADPGKTGTGVLVATYTATAAANASVSNALAYGTGLTTGAAGASPVFLIQDRDQATVPNNLTTSTSVFSVAFTPTFTTTASTTIGLPAFSCATSGVTTCGLRIVTYIPYIAGAYNVRVYANTFETVQSSARSGWTLTITPGVVSAPDTVLTSITGTTLVAGSTYQLTAQLSDAYTNKITSGGATITFAASTIYTTPVVVDHSDGTYTITTTFNTAGQQTFVPLVGGVATNGVSVLVTAGTVSATTSTCGTIPSQVTAGTASALFVVTLLDAWSNSITTAPTCVTSLTSNTGMTQTMAASAPGSNAYLLSFTPTVADYSSVYSAQVTCAGVAIGSAQSVQVIPGTVDGTKSNMTLGTGPFTASSVASFLIELKDSLGNPWRTFKQPVTSSSRDSLQMSVLYSASIVYNTARSFSSLAATITHDDTRPGKGFYYVTLTPKYSSPGDYSFTFTADSVAYVPENLKTMTVVAGSAILIQTVLPTGGLLNDLSKGLSYPAGTPFNVTIKLRDTLQNPITTGGLASQMLVTYYLKYTTSYCLLGVKDTSDSVQSQFNTTIVDNTDGSYTIEIMTKVRGLYWFDIVMTNDGQTLITDSNCISIPDMTAFTVAPLTADPGHTVLSSILSGRAGDVMSFTVTLHDKYDNLVTETNHNITTGDASLCTVNPYNYSAFTLANTGGVVSGTSPVFTITFQVNVSNYYVVPVTLDGVLASATAGSCPIVYVKPAAITAVKFTSSGNITAGLATTLTLETSDRYGNPVYSNGLSTTTIPIFTTTFTRASGASYVVATESVYTGTTSYPIVSTSFEADGTMGVVVYLPADPLDTTTADQTWTTTITVLPAACSSIDETKPYRCPSNSACVSSYDQCPSYTACAIAGGGVICPGTLTCVASINSCDTTTLCTGSTTFCATSTTSGYCSLSGTCPLGTQDNYCVGEGKINCGNGMCRNSLAECPSQKVCPPFTIVCPDGSSCAVNSTSCPPLPTITCVSPLSFQCRDNTCVSRAEDCGTEKTCSDSKVVCPDGSCKSDATQCTETFTCLSGTVRCPNGECRTRSQDCPTSKTCAPDYVLCENGACASSLSLCTAALECTSGVRCPDGTCRPNRMQCTTLVTCPVAFPVLCGDNSCVRDVAQCGPTRVCPDEEPHVCPDNSCSMYNTTCPTTMSCPSSLPTLCADGTCVLTRDSCPMLTAPPASCPPFRPYRCSDGSCVGSWTYCPTKQIKCFDYAPVLCPDHRCVSSAEMCLTVSLTVCTTGMTRCPNGGCAWSRALCPTQVSCGLGYVRGTDGSCKLESLLSGNTTTVGTFTVGASPGCDSDQIICPQNHQGYSCAATLADCPQDVTCPRSRPIRCSDASCAMSLEDCYAVVPTSGSTISCPGSASISSGTCGASTTCPTYAPTKCWDESCRILPEDCPPQAKCDSTNYFLCSNGQCVTSPLSCTSGQKCNTGTLVVKCPWSAAGVSQCVTSVAMCSNIFTDAPSKTCPDSYSRCRDGSCSVDSSGCAALACPTQTPFVCPDGLCARTVNECNAANGCPFDSSYKCGDGSCVASSSSCPTTTLCSDTSYTRCADGSCPNAANACRTNSTGCDDGSQLCADGQCALDPAYCIDSTDDYNACPAYRPYRCADGFCAMSSYLCPIIPLSVALTTPTNTGSIVRSVRCGDGSQVAFGVQCPTMRACSSTTVRCSNNQCRSLLALCPASNPCALMYPLTSTSPAGVRCATGHCAPSSGACFDETTGCSTIASYKCNNGQCVVGPTQCPADLPLLAQPSNGCAITSPYKCLDGSCATAFTMCPAANGCPAATPYLCADGTCLSTATCPTATSSTACASGVRCPNNQCMSSWSLCSMSNGCPISTPVRCANGQCKKYPAGGTYDSDTCAPTVVCDALNPFLCVDSTCVSNPLYCRAVLPCPITTPLMCTKTDGTPTFQCELTTNSTCPTVAPTCPTQSPVLCPDGACMTSIAQCASRTTTACPTGQIRCFDGECRNKALDCAASAFSIYQGITTTLSTTATVDTGVCASSSLTLCPDGSCVKSSSLCGLVAACPSALPLRCPNGACVNATTTTCASIGSCTSPAQRCEDGLCRTTCLPFSGCPLTVGTDTGPYSCFGRAIACTADQASCVSGSSFASRRRLLADTTTTTLEGQEACIDCQNNIVAATQTVALSANVDQTIDVSVDSSSVPRTQLYIPAGAFAGAATKVSIVPVESSDLSFAVSPTSQSSMSAGPFLFSTNILSTPFWFTVDNTAAPVNDRGITVLAAIDNIVYDPYATDSSTTSVIVPCEIQGPTFAVVQDASIYVTGSKPAYTCSGSLTFTSTTVKMAMDPTCEAINIFGTYAGQGGAVTQAWDGTSSTSCDCFNVTSATLAKPSPLPPYASKNNTAIYWSRYQVGNQVCLYVTRTQTEYSMAIYTSEARAALVCPFRGKETNAVFYTMTRATGDGCAGATVGGNRVMSPNDICLASVDTDLGTWSCLKPSRADRLANPTWSTTSGRPQNRVAGQVTASKSAVLAFAYIPIPAAPVAAAATCNLWCQYKWLIIGLLIGFTVFIVLMSYVLWRFKRYRDKYREQKMHVEQLREHARDIDENRGGLGVADEDVVMMANPLVVEMKNLDEQLTRVNIEMDTQHEKDSHVIEQLSQERERLNAEIIRVRTEMAAQQSTAATRMEDIHLSQAHMHAPPPASSTSGLVPMEMEGPEHDGSVAISSAGQERHEFAQVRRPAKKKE